MAAEDASGSKEPWAKILAEKDQRMETCPEGLPPFSAGAIDALICHYGVQNDPHTLQVAQGMGRAPVRHPYLIGEATAEQMMRSLANRELLQTGRTGSQAFVRQAENWVETNFPTIDMRNASCVGMGIILKAYEAEYGYPALMFLDEGIPASKLGDGFRASTVSPADRFTIITRARKLDEIPSYQIPLNAFLDRYVTIWVPQPLEESVKQGAQGMYHALDHVWENAIPSSFKYKSNSNHSNLI